MSYYIFLLQVTLESHEHNCSTIPSDRKTKILIQTFFIIYTRVFADHKSFVLRLLTFALFTVDVRDVRRKVSEFPKILFILAL